ncbi:hypothetical protein QA601_10485 [Chitinispirillales bacterium ANBcel5]|uniref:hypothetical protein n=1 Tax=Cellulosispirillum alkaliphilum TaxID=3039283 RepID=UPI002A53542B|nr:hypothetical protein [Chitinispirillales bacterium ANBcel5]
MKNAELITQLEKQYNIITGKNLDFLTKAGLAKTECTTCQLFFDNCSGNVDSFEDLFINSYLKDKPPLGDIDQFRLDIKDYFVTYGELIYNKQTDYLKISAQIYVDLFINRYKQAGFTTPKLPPECSKGGYCIDLAAGFNYIDFFEDLNPSTTYFLIDKSYFTCECLKYKVRKLGLKNVNVYCGCVKDFDVSILNKHKIVAIRAKNILTYVPDFYNYIDKFKSIICRNGCFVFQESINSGAMNIHLFNRNKYFSDGWDFVFNPGRNTEDPFCFHTLVCTKIA